MTSQSAIRCDALQVRFGDTRAVDGLSFEVPRGALFGFLGPNGAGKSTTLSVLCTLRRPTAGSAQVAGFDVARAPSEVRRRIGVLFQDPCVDDRLTGFENLRLHAMVYGVPRKVRAARLEEASTLTGLADALSRPVRTYSGGMRRRLELARALLHQPEILFLDEPTGGLDAQTRRTFWQHLGALRAQRGMTVFLTTHYLEEAEDADAVAIIDRGRIVAAGTPHALKAQFAAGRRDRPGQAPRGPAPMHDAATPTTALEDVYVALTGAAIRDDAASERDHVRGAVRRRGSLR